MAEFLLRIVTHPLESTAILLSIGGAIGFAIFMGGFFGGSRQLIKIDMNDDHLAHMRTRAIWGVVLMAFFFGLWECVRFIAALIMGEPLPNNSWVVYLTAFVILALIAKHFIFPSKGGH